ncbi:diacylglycerol kinase family protein [Paenibacillus thiaminolyticus]|uniref:Diacylglycerol kinase family protein n=1 Tax=Paenibacillus thiaminolyticus TaxID=49283 RepID=A0A3A3GMB3_PANTH|nr:diacylglycerol kinase family protein [Paenibacillus thiaminolyticus]RJG26123.1 diacylglycerol kinase family protein [Paenibacillus thiaminolyticus]
MRRPWANTFRVAWEGILYAFRTQRNMRVHAAAAVAACLLGAGFRISTGEWLWLALAITLVVSAELMNTAVESAVDLTMPDPHPLAKITKDTAAGAVLVTAVFAVIVGVVLFAGRLLQLLRTFI